MGNCAYQAASLANTAVPENTNTGFAPMSIGYQSIAELILHGGSDSRGGLQ